MPPTTIHVRPAGVPDETTPAAETRDLARLFRRSPALAGVTLRVQPGRAIAVLGPNGAGKTTLLRVLATSLRPSFGTAFVDGIDVAQRPDEVRRRVALMPHATGLYDDLTAADNVRFWGRAAGAAPADVDAALATCGLAGRLADVPVRRLSAGQRRRTSLACVVARRPELWLLDEPHAGLDAEGRDRIDDLVRAAASAGATVLFASHELDRAERLAGRVVELVGGTTVAPRRRRRAAAKEPALVP